MLHPLSVYQEYPPDEMECRARMFRQDLERRRSVRDFSDRSVSKKLIENLLLTAGTAPSGANMQPWHFVAVSDPQIKAIIRIGAEREEKEFYNGKAPKEWVDALAPLGTNEKKPF